MSNLIFPTLPLLDARAEKEPLWDGQDFVAPGGRRQSYLYSDRPRWRWRLRAHARGIAWQNVESELETLWRFYNAHGGAWDSFLYRDPDDYQASDHGFGVGNGSTTVFQLQRAMAGASGGVLGSYPLATKRRINYCLQSQNLSAAANWLVQTGVNIVADCAMAPDGTPTADRISYDGTGSAGLERIWQVAATPFTPGAWNTVSIWLRSDVPVSLRLLNYAGGSSTISVTAEWQRFSVSSAWSGTASQRLMISGAAGDNSAFEVYAWGGQCELGATATAYIPTTTAAGVSTPAYWPATGDGFEPVSEPGPDLALTVEGDGLGVRPLAQWQRTNLVPYSEQFNDASWSKGTGVTVTANATNAPDGSMTADLVSYNGTGTANANRIWRTIGLVYRNHRRTSSIWMYAATPVTLRLIDALGGVTTCDVTTSWQRYTVTGVGDGATSSQFVICSGTAGDNAAFSVYLWGAQQEVGSIAGDYIPTTTAAASRTDYALGANGQITMAVAPRSGAQLAWSGSFYRRVRFAQRGLSMQRLMQGLWSAEGIELGMVI